MKQENSNNNTVKWIILIVVSIGIGSFMDDILENIGINVWLARAIGALVTVIGALILYNLLIKNTKKQMHNVNNIIK